VVIAYSRLQTFASDQVMKLFMRRSQQLVDSVVNPCTALTRLSTQISSTQSLEASWRSSGRNFSLAPEKPIFSFGSSDLNQTCTVV